MLSNERHTADGEDGFRDLRSATPEAQREFWSNPNRYRVIASGIQHAEADQLLSYLNPDTLNSLRSIVDVGCGDGSFTIDRLANAAPNATLLAVDKSAAMAQATTQYAEDSGLSQRVRSLTLDISTDVEQLKRVLQLLDPQTEGMADLVFSNSTLHHIYSWNELRSALRNIRELLGASHPTHNGILLAQFAGAGNFDELIAAADFVKSGEQWQPYFKDWKGYPLLRPDADTMQSELRALGFDVDGGRVELVPMTVMLSGKDELFAFCRGCMRSFGAYLQERLNSSGDSEVEIDQKLNSFFESVAERYLQSTPADESGRIPFPLSNIEIAVRGKALGPTVGAFADGAKLEHSDAEKRLISFLEEVSQLPEVRAYAPIKKELLGLQPGMTVLDAGCGTGLDSLWMGKAVGKLGHVIAVDRNQARLDYTRDRLRRDFSESEGPRFTFLAEDLIATSLDSDALDAVLCERVLIHVSDPATVLREFFKLLKPGGALVLVEPDFSSLHFDSNSPELTKRIVQARASEITNPTVANELEELLDSVGFAEVSREIWKLNHSFSASKLLDLDDISRKIHKPTAEYPLPTELSAWLSEQEERATLGIFRSTTPMHLVRAVKN